jgi:hypothetical protein
MNIETYGGLPDGSNTTPALNAAVQAAITGADKSVHFNAGAYSFLTTPATIPGLVRISGEGKSSTTLHRNYQGGEFLLATGNGFGLRDLTLWAEAGTSGGVALHLLASNTVGAGGNHEIENVWITGQGTWMLPLLLDGIERTVAPAGLRTVSLKNVSLFNATWWGAEFWNCVGCEWFGGGCYQGFGTTQAIVVGGALSTKNYINADIDYAASTIWAGSLRA